MSASLKVFPAVAVATLALAAAILASDPFNAPNASVIDGFRATVEKHANGVDKTRLMADKAAIDLNGKVTATNVTVLFFNDRGEPEGTAKAPHVVYETGKQSGRADGHSVFERRDLTIEGDGLVWSGEKNRAWFTSNSVVTIYQPAN